VITDLIGELFCWT